MPVEPAVEAPAEPVAEKSSPVSFVRVRVDFGTHCVDLPSGMVQIEGRGVYVTDDPEVIEILSRDPELTRYAVDPAPVKSSRKK